MCLCIFPHNFLSVIYKIINNTQDITFGEYISLASTFLYNSINNIKAIKQHMITRMSVCISDSVYSIWSFTWQKHDANFDMHIVFFLFNWIELNSCLFPFFFSRHCFCFDQCFFFAQIEFVSDFLHLLALKLRFLFGALN